jgi:hypothetical protein
MRRRDGAGAHVLASLHEATMSAPALALLTAILAVCGSSNGGFAPITDDEVSALGLRQGLAGDSALRSGDCMPGPDVASSCRYSPLTAELWILPAANAGLVNAVKPNLSGCLIAAEPAHRGRARRARGHRPLGRPLRNRAS